MSVRSPSPCPSPSGVTANLARRRTPRASNAQTLDVALLLSTYQKPWHLRRVLASIAMQEHVQDRMELVVTDDGSSDETADIVVRFAQSVPFPVRFSTHPHQGFQLAKCRNAGVLASTAPYLLFLDGDCLLPPDHVWQHLQHRRTGEVMGGYCVRLDQPTSERIDEAAIRSQAYLSWIPHRDLRGLAIRDWKARFYRLLRHPHKPKLAGGNIGLWRKDFEKINGYDEKFHGWGGEDDDLRQRLVRTGTRINSILRWTRTYHLWHPAEPSAPAKASLGGNYQYLARRGALTQCRQGLVKRSLSAMRVRLAAHTAWPPAAQRFLDTLSPALPQLHATNLNKSAITSQQAPEIEIAFHPGQAKFSAHSECRVLIVLADSESLSHQLLEQADIILSDASLPHQVSQRVRPLAEVESVLESLG